MNMCAVEGLASNGRAVAARSSFSNASARAQGFRLICAPAASATYSRAREMAIWINMAASGARMARRNHTDDPTRAAPFLVVTLSTAPKHRRELRHPGQQS